MTDEEFEQWKEDHGWYFTWIDLISIISFIAMLWILVAIS